MSVSSFHYSLLKYFEHLQNILVNTTQLPFSIKSLLLQFPLLSLLVTLISLRLPGPVLLLVLPQSQPIARLLPHPQSHMFGSLPNLLSNFWSGSKCGRVKTYHSLQPAHEQAAHKVRRPPEKPTLPFLWLDTNRDLITQKINLIELSCKSNHEILAFYVIYVIRTKIVSMEDNKW